MTHISIYKTRECVNSTVFIVKPKPQPKPKPKTRVESKSLSKANKTNLIKSLTIYNIKHS